MSALLSMEAQTIWLMTLEHWRSFVKEGGIHLNCLSFTFPRIGLKRPNTSVRGIKCDKYPENTV